MEEVSCRLLPDAVGAGPQNMAADQVLLESAAAGVASLRFYAWSTATVSLGYFQRERDRLTDEFLAQRPFVRRPSGGAMLVHDQELTYALALPCSRRWQIHRQTSTWLVGMHRMIEAALARFGIRAEVSEKAIKQGGPLCFHHIVPGDLLIEGHKVAGGAQRKLHGALLQHGAILLTRSAFAPSLPGLKELAGFQPTARNLRDSICAVFASHTGWTLSPANWTEEENNRIWELATARYGASSWNCKR